MARARRRQQRKSERDERRRSESPTVFTAAGLLAFYEEEDALVRIKPIHVVIATVGFMAAVVVLTVLGLG